MFIIIFSLNKSLSKLQLTDCPLVQSFGPTHPLAPTLPRIVLHVVFEDLATVVRLQIDINLLPAEGRLSTARILVIGELDCAARVVVVCLE